MACVLSVVMWRKLCRPNGVCQLNGTRIGPCMVYSEPEPDGSWWLWETVDSRRRSFGREACVAGLSSKRVCVFFTKKAPSWAGWLPGSRTSGLGMSRGMEQEGCRNTIHNPCLHIVESIDMEKMAEETPTDYYYDCLRSDLGKRYPKANSFLLDHLVSLEAFLDKSIVFGFSFGIPKAEVCVVGGKLLGHKIGRYGSSPDEERCQAVIDFPPLKEKLHIQQFLGCSNWLRVYLPAEYGHAAKVLGAWQKVGAEFPPAGLGAAETEGCKAFKAIKKMLCHCISLSTFDEASAADGSCPLEQIADASGIAVGGTVLQMSRDMSHMKVLMTHSKSLTPAQQSWPPLIQEAYAQLEVKRATRRVFGTIKSLCWTDHANLTRAQMSDIGVDSKLIRWVSEILADGSEIRSLSGRSAKLGDGFSRNPKDRDALLEARTKDLSGMAGQLRGFNLDEYLGEGTEGNGQIPWAVGDDAVPDQIAVVANKGLQVSQVKVLVVVDYQRWNDSNAVLRDARRKFERSLPGISVSLRACYGPFEDDEGSCSHFDGAVGRLTGSKKLKRLRVDALTSCAKVLREIAAFVPDFLVGFGQGGIIVALVRRPLVVELTLQARNLQQKEVRAVGAAWGALKCAWTVDPRIWKSQIGSADIEAACPEVKKEFPVEPVRGFGVSTKTGRPDDSQSMFDALKLTKVPTIDSVGLRSLLQEPKREMWEHEGLCTCGKRTYLFSRCPTCIEQEASQEVEALVESAENEEAEEQELPDGLEVEMLAMSSATSGGKDVFVIPVRLLAEWGKHGQAVKEESFAEVKFGFLNVSKWKPGKGNPKLGSSNEKLPYLTTWVVMKNGTVLLGHQCCREDKNLRLSFEWALAGGVNWHNHRLLVDEVCEAVWKDQKNVKFELSFLRLLGLVGICERIEGWDDGKGSESIAHRKSLRQFSVLVCFQKSEQGHWDEIQLAKKIEVSEGMAKPTLAFVGKVDDQERVVLSLRTSRWVLTDWELKERSIHAVFAGKEDAGMRRETLAEAAREAAGISEFRVTGSLRSSWYEAQRKDESLAGQFRKVDYPFVLAADGLLEREVQITTGEVVKVAVVPNGVAAANGLTWRRACYNAVHCGVLGAHRSASVTHKLLERAVWWPSMEEDIKRWVGCCLSCLKGRSRPTRVEAKAVKCTASTCWEEVSVDCEGPNREDQHGYRYSLTYFCCLSHAVLLEPLKSLTHAEVRRGFTRCIMRSRTIPSLVRSDRGVEFKNTLMAEMNALLGVQQRFSMALRPCEMGSNERVHQEVQKVLGALLREIGSTETWSDLLVVAEFILDTTPGPHGYAPRDLERSWSLAHPLEKDVLREALQFEPISDWARDQFVQFKEIASKVAKHWEKSSAARTKLANRFRRTVDLQIGDRVIWRSPKARPEGAGRVPWRVGLHGPWKIVEIKGNRLLLEPVPPVVGPTPSFSRRQQEAHAEDCVLIPAGADEIAPREPIVFEDAQEGQAPSLGQQVVGDVQQVEFTVQRRGRSYVLRLGEKIAYRKAGTAKECYLGKVTQADVALAQVGVHKFLPEVGGVRVKWRLGFLDEKGQLGYEGARPALEPVKVKEIITKVDINKDGVLAASSSRKLDKGGYSLSTGEVRRVGAVSVPGTSIVSDQVLALLEEAGPPLSSLPPIWSSGEGQKVQEWLTAHPVSVVHFWDVLGGVDGLTDAMRNLGHVAVPPLGQGCAGCGRSWDLTTAVDQELFWALYEELQPLAVHMQLPEGPSGRVLRELANRLFCQQEKQGRRATGQGSVKDTLWQDPAWIQSFGTLCGPRAPWNNVRTDGCQFGLSVENGQLWIGNFSLSSCSLRCKRPDALGTALHEHARPPIGPSQQDGSILNFAYAWNLRKSLRLDPPSAGPRCLAGTRPELCLSRCLADTRTTSSQQEKIFAGQEGFEPDVQSGDALPPEKKEQLEKEVAKLSGEMHELWRVRADRREWDEVKADLGVYRLSGQEVVSDPRRTEPYRQQVVAGLGFGADAGEKRPAMNPDDLAACREVLARKAGGFWVEGSPRTTVRNVMHDCVPIGPPVSQQPHNLKGEAAAWVDEKLEEEVQRGQLIRGSSAWGSSPFPTKEAPAHKRHRKRRLVVDYRRVNARVKRSTYYCRKATDVLASCAGSVWYSFLDAVTGFNQIANTKRAMEVFAIVARSGKFLPVCLTFGPVNGPDDFCFVVDRAFGPGRGRKLRYTREWVAYVDDLTIIGLVGSLTVSSRLTTKLKRRLRRHASGPR